MLAIKLKRIGKKHQPSYRVVIAEKRSKLIGPPVEDLGAYNTMTKQLLLKKDRVEYWLAQGAKPTVTVHNLLVREAVIQGPKEKVPMRAGKKKDAVHAPAAVAETSHETRARSGFRLRLMPVLTPAA